MEVIPSPIRTRLEALPAAADSPFDRLPLSHSWGAERARATEARQTGRSARSANPNRGPGGRRAARPPSPPRESHVGTDAAGAAARLARHRHVTASERVSEIATEAVCEQWIANLRAEEAGGSDAPNRSGADENGRSGGGGAVFWKSLTEYGNNRGEQYKNEFAQREQNIEI